MNDRVGQVLFDSCIGHILAVCMVPVGLVVFMMLFSLVMGFDTLMKFFSEKVS